MKQKLTSLQQDAEQCQSTQSVMRRHIAAIYLFLWTDIASGCRRARRDAVRAEARRLARGMASARGERAASEVRGRRGRTRIYHYQPR